MSICNEDLEKQHSEESDGVQLAEVFPQPSSSHIDVSYDLEQFWAYTQSYQRISHFYEYDDLPHHTDFYISPIQSLIEESCKSTYQFGKKIDDIIHAYDSPSSPPILNHHIGLHFMNKVSLLWLVTKDKDFFYVNKMFRWLHWIFYYT